MTKLTLTTLATVLCASGAAWADTGTRFDETDANKDGFITQAEIAAHRAARFATQDTDGSGDLSKEELSAHMKAKAAERGRTLNDKRAARRIDRMFKRLDKDANGVLTLAELPTRDKRFDRVDANDDGKISRAEADSAKSKRQSKRKEKRKDKRKNKRSE